MRFLTCEPNLKQKDNYKDEAEQFFDSPVRWLRSHIPSYPRTAKPSHVVIYEQLADRIIDFLSDYKQLHKITNAEVINYYFGHKSWADLNYFLQHIQATSGKNILIFQRLHTGEENAFNREEFQNQNDKLEASKEDIIYKQEENAFNQVES